MNSKNTPTILDKGTFSPPLRENGTTVLHVAIASLAIGGAERIVIDWISRLNRDIYKVRLAVLHDQQREYSVPDGVDVVRFHSTGIFQQMSEFVSFIPEGGVIVTHLVQPKYLSCCSSYGVRPIPVIHNAKEGWRHDPLDFEKVSAPKIISVSSSAAGELKEHGISAPVDITRHVPLSGFVFSEENRGAIRTKYRVPETAVLILCSGRLKPQKNYPEAVKTLREVLDAGSDARLVILGGYDGEEGKKCYKEICEAIAGCKVAGKVIMPGFVSPEPWLSAADVFLNVSHYEGVSIATIEAAQAGLPCISRDAGGQSEIRSKNVFLVGGNGTPRDFANSLLSNRTVRSAETIPSYGHRLWTLHSLTPLQSGNGVLFLTSNLNAGGAQRSLVRLAKSLHFSGGAVRIGVQMKSTSPAFIDELLECGIDAFMPCEKNDVFSFAENIGIELQRNPVESVCFWNLDVKAKSVVMKMLRGSNIKVVDASPGHYAFSEMNERSDFMEIIGETPKTFHDSLSALVFKYSPKPDEIPTECSSSSIQFIPNGIDIPECLSTLGKPRRRFLVCGRIAESKRPELIVEAFFKAAERCTGISLSFVGATEPSQKDLALRLEEITRGRTDIVWEGADADIVGRMHEYDALIVIGTNQGCPNTVLEGLASRLPVIANDSGGTREQIVDWRTGILLRESPSADELAVAIEKIARSEEFSDNIAKNGHVHVCKEFSMSKMHSGWRSLLLSESLVLNDEHLYNEHHFSERECLS